MAGDGPIKVLVVDDSAVMRKLISSILDRDAGVEVVATAIDGDFALNKIEQIRPDVITMDIDMPRMDGITALRHIVAKHSVPVVNAELAYVGRRGNDYAGAGVGGGRFCVQAWEHRRYSECR